MNMSTSVSTIPQSELDALLTENRELRAANRDLEIVAYAIAHDLRTPLLAIRGFAHLIETDCAECISSEAIRSLEIIQSSVEQVQEMSVQWLSLLQKRTAIARVDDVSVSELAESVVKDLQIADTARRVFVDIQPSLTASADKTLLRELLQNLIGNAWKFTTHANDPRIEVGGYRDRDRWVYFVRDNGIGIADVDQDRLFEPFVRGLQNKSIPGSGVGLTIARRIVELHSGKIWTQSAPGKGATFKFTLGSERGQHSLQ